MLSEQSRAIRHHAIVGASIAFVLALAELLVRLAEKLLSAMIDDYPVRAAFVWVAVALLFSCAAYEIVGRFIESREKQWRVNRIPIAVLGSPADGRWIQAVIQAGEVIEVTELEISSSEINGFAVEGKAHKVESVGVLKKLNNIPHGAFSGEQGRLFGQKGFGFVFEGKLDGKPVFEVTSYQFEKGTEHEGLTFLSGTFHESVSNTVFDVCGRSIVEELPRCDVESAMKDWINHDRVNKACDKSKERK